MGKITTRYEYDTRVMTHVLLPVIHTPYSYERALLLLVWRIAVLFCHALPTLLIDNRLTTKAY